jgi:hypothetical protein
MYFWGWVYCPTVQACSLGRRVGYRAGQKNLAESEFGEFIAMEKESKLLLIESIRQSQKFDKPSYRDY